jgi:hypothetical protein
MKLITYSTGSIFNDYSIKNNVIVLKYIGCCGLNQTKYYINHNNIDVVYQIKEFDLHLAIAGFSIFIAGFSEIEIIDTISVVAMELIGFLLIMLSLILFLWKPIVIRTKTMLFISSPYKMCSDQEIDLLNFCVNKKINMDSENFENTELLSRVENL